MTAVPNPWPPLYDAWIEHEVEQSRELTKCWCAGRPSPCPYHEGMLDAFDIAASAMARLTRVPGVGGGDFENAKVAGVGGKFQWCEGDPWRKNVTIEVDAG